jgi:hypothetical protein
MGIPDKAEQAGITRFSSEPIIQHKEKRGVKEWNRAFVARTREWPLKCAKCGKAIFPGEPYFVEYFSHKVTCNRCIA